MIPAAWALGEEMAGYITNTVFADRAEIVLEMEKILRPLIAFSKKKMYASMKFETANSNCGKVSFSGLAVKRRDNALILRSNYKALLEIMVLCKTPDEVAVRCLPILESQLRSLVDGDEKEISQFVITVAYRATVKSQKLSQVQVVKKTNRRISEGKITRNPYRSGDRIPFVIIKKTGETNVAYKAEDPEWVRTHPELQIDKVYYLQKQLRRPISDLLRVAVGVRVDDMFEKYLNKLIRIDSGMHSIVDMFGGSEAKTRQQGLSSAAKRKLVNDRQTKNKKKQRTMTSFFQKK